MSQVHSDMFIKNMGVLSREAMDHLMSCHVMIVGLGGLGGHVANHLVRLGVQHLSLVDSDRYVLSNLNRQLFSTQADIGDYKVNVVCRGLKQINPDLVITSYRNDIRRVDPEWFETPDYMIDCTDNPETKRYLHELSKRWQIPVLHGACAGWYGQVGWITPQATLIEELYENDRPGLEEDLLNPSFTPAMLAGVMVSEFAKMISGLDPVVDELLLIDLLNNEMHRSGKAR